MKVLITGSAKRIGAMLAQHLASQGCQIAVHYNTSSKEAKHTFENIGGSENGHFLIQANLADLDETSGLISNLEKNWGKPNILINNASTYFRRGVDKFSNKELLEDYTVNFFSPFILMREFKNICGNGKIINILDRRINSIDPEAGPYAMAKKSLRDATEACAKDWFPEISVNAIAPGPILLPDEDFHNNILNEKLCEIRKNVSLIINSNSNGQIIII